MADDAAIGLEDIEEGEGDTRADGEVNPQGIACKMAFKPPGKEFGQSKCTDKQGNVQEKHYPTRHG
jgi:hypothetical protein